MVPFTFYSPTLFAFGPGAASRTGELVRRFGGTKVLLVYGGGSIKRNGAYEAVTRSLQEAGIPWAELSGVQPNPRSGKVYEGIELCRKEGADLVLAVGGGSAIDTAKCIGFGVPYDGDFWDFFTGKKKFDETLPVGTVLTIAAAGSEGSDSAVITHDDGDLKWGIPRSDVVRPKFSILDPATTCSLPPYQTACGACDMFMHIVERYFTNTPAVRLTDRLCEALMRTVVEAGTRAMADPNDLEARSDLMWAGMLAHNDSVGVGREQDWASHRLEHELSAFYDCAHGAGLSVIGPNWMRYVVEHDPSRFAQYAVEVFGCEMDYQRPERTAAAGIERTARFFHETLGLPATLSDIGGKEEDIPAMVEHIANKPNAYPFGKFVRLDKEKAAEILRLCV